jgi:hypothetical protein
MNSPESYIPTSGELVEPVLQVPGAKAGACDNIEERRRRLGMTNIQLYLAIGLPIIAVLTSLTVSLLQVSAIRGEMRGIRADFREDMHSLRAEFREDMRALRTDLNTLTGKVVEIDNRLTRIEERLEHR